MFLYLSVVAISCAIIGFVIVIGKIVVCFLSPVVETRQWHVSTVVGVLYVVKSLVCCWLSDWGHRPQNHPTQSPLPYNAFAFIIQCCLRLLTMLSEAAGGVAGVSRHFFVYLQGCACFTSLCKRFLWWVFCYYYCKFSPKMYHLTLIMLNGGG